MRTLIPTVLTATLLGCASAQPGEVAPLDCAGEWRVEVLNRGDVPLGINWQIQQGSEVLLGRVEPGITGAFKVVTDARPTITIRQVRSGQESRLGPPIDSSEDLEMTLACWEQALTPP